MTIPIIVPELGESVLEATVHQWFKAEGDFVRAGEALVELETDKVNLEVGAQQDGKLAKILASEGQDVKVGDELGQIEATAEPERAPVEKAPEPKADRKPETPKPSEKSGDNRPASASPLAQRIAEQEGIDLAKVEGSGPGGRIVKEDVQQYLQTFAPAAEEPPAQTPSTSPGAPATEPTAPEKPPNPPSEQTSQVVVEAGRSEKRLRMSRRRRTIAQRLVEAQHNAAMLTTFNEIDMSAIMDLRKRRGPDFLERHEVKLGITSFFVKASIGGLRAFPRLNAEIQGDEIILKNYYDIGVAIGAEEGLVVPVLRDADRLSFAEIERQIKSYVEKSQQGRLSIEDLTGGTFTITNGGVFGSLFSTPILNPPQVGILGLHKIEQRPMAVGDQVVVRPMMYVALSYDHRVVDGREAVQFLVQIKQLLEDPERLLLEG